MAYTPQTWHDFPLTDTPVNAARMTHIETGLQAAAAVADAAGGGGSLVDNGNGTWTATSGLTDNGDGTWTG